MHATPCDIFANRLPVATQTAIHAFWQQFEGHATALDAWFSQTGPEQDVLDVMAALTAIEEGLMCEFGPSESGHLLAITAEWRKELRPLAHAVVMTAPKLPRWQCSDVRLADPIETAPQVFAGRFRQRLALTAIEFRSGDNNKVDITAQGIGSDEEVFAQAEGLITVLMGEALERDWLGRITAQPTRKSNGLLRGGDTATLDLARVKAGFLAQIAQIQSSLPQLPDAAQDLEIRAVQLYQLDDLGPQSGRPDMFTFQSPTAAYADAALSTAFFASANHSNFADYFVFLRIARMPDHPFDDITDRADIEYALHQAPSNTGAGGVVGSGQGTEAIYFDLAFQDIDAGFEILQKYAETKPWAQSASLHFLEGGFSQTGLPLASLQRKSH